MKNIYSQKAGAFFFFCTLFLFSFNGVAQVGIGNTDPKSALDVNGALSLREGTALTLSSSGNANNQNIDLGTTIYSQYRIIGPTASFNVLTFNTPVGVSANDGQLLTLINTTPHRMTIVHDQGSNQNQQRRIYCPTGSNLVLDGQYSTVSLQYNTSLERWIVIAYTDMGGYGRNVYNKVGSTDAFTNSENPSDMADMEITFIPKHPVVYLNFSASGNMDKGNNSEAQAYANFQLLKDNIVIAGTTTLASDRSYINSGTPSCREMFYDQGGPTSNYPNNENRPRTFTPTNSGEKVSVSFLSFNTEPGWDGLMVYNGPTTAFPLISSGSTYNRPTCPNGAWTGIGLFSAQDKTFTSTAPNGELTFVFTSDGSMTYPGWEACVTSGVGPPPPNFSLDTAWNAGFTMYPVNVTPGVSTTIKIRWMRSGNRSLPNVLRNNVSSDIDRSHRSLTIFD